MGAGRRSTQGDAAPMSYEVTLIRGDGVGPELAEAARMCIEASAQVEAECQAARQLQAQALAERDAALAARDDVARERESIRGAIDQLNAKVAHQVSSRGAAMVMRRALLQPAAFRTHPPLLPRALAIIVLMAAVVVLLIVLHVA